MDENKKQRNSEYIGVDEKYIPEEEKYVDESLIGDREKSRKRTKKIGVTYIVLFLIVAIFPMVFLLLGPSMLARNSGVVNQAVQEIDEAQKISDFNQSLVDFRGTQSIFSTESLLDEVIVKNEAGDHKVTVVYGEVTSDTEEGITDIKHSLERITRYEISFDYDSVGYINKVIVDSIE